jgi:ABC-2 type transport system ATP-binding protein
VIRTRALVKRFGRLRAVDGIELDVRAGDVYGFLGANGSGKTTTVRMLLGLVLPTSGEVELLGERMPRAARRVLPHVGALIEGPAHHGHLSGRANLALLDAAGPGGSRRTRRRRIDEVLEQVGLGGIDRRPVRAYSLGMRQRLGLAAALLGDPHVLILDEPANGLDPAGMAWLRGLLRGLAAEGRTVLFSSHVLSEVAQTVDHLIIVNHGELGYAGPLGGLDGPLEAAFLRLTAEADSLTAEPDSLTAEPDSLTAERNR